MPKERFRESASVSTIVRKHFSAFKDIGLKSLTMQFLNFYNGRNKEEIISF